MSTTSALTHKETEAHGYLQQCKEHCPSLTLDDLLSVEAGICAQAVMHDGSLTHIFCFLRPQICSMSVTRLPLLRTRRSRRRIDLPKRSEQRMNALPFFLPTL